MIEGVEIDGRGADVDRGGGSRGGAEMNGERRVEGGRKRSRDRKEGRGAD